MGEKGKTICKENNTKLYTWILPSPGMELNSHTLLSVGLVTHFQKIEDGRGKISNLTAQKPGRHGLN